MKRRRVLEAAGFVGSLGLFGLGRWRPSPTLSVSVWFSEAAAAYDGLDAPVGDLLGPALAHAGLDASIGFGDRPVELDAEGGRRPLAETWPRLVAQGLLGQGPVRPVRDVNLLVTDGDPGVDPAGYGMRGVAAVTGAAYLASLPAGVLDAGEVEASTAGTVAQLLLHECGHAIGLDHAHGCVAVDGETVTASPMVGGYAWADEEVRRRQLGREANACGEPFPAVGERRRRLGLRYSDCARRAAGRRSAAPVD